MTSGADEGDMTLAFELDAIRAFTRPRSVFADARRWSRYVGVVADDAEAVETYVRRCGLRQDFEIGRLPKQSVLSQLKWEATTDRHVYVGTTDEHRDLADYVNWEYRPVEVVAAKAGWTLAADATVMERLRSRVTRSRLWPFPIRIR